MRSHIGTAVMALGVLFLAYAAGTYLQLTPGSQTALPAPPAIARATATAEAAAREAAVASPAPALAAAAAPSVTPAASPNHARSRPPRRCRPCSRPPCRPPPPWRRPPPCPHPPRLPPRPCPACRPVKPVSFSIPKIGLQTEVQEAGVITDRNGNPFWETRPFVAVHYDVTGPAGAPGNPVIAGHVVTLYEGNVFRNLYQVDFGDDIEVRTDRAEFTYLVDEIKLVDPSDTSVMQPSRDARFDARSRAAELRPADDPVRQAAHRGRQAGRRIIWTIVGRWASFSPERGAEGPSERGEGMAEGERRSSVLYSSTADLLRRLINDADGLIELQIRWRAGSPREPDAGDWRR